MPDPAVTDETLFEGGPRVRLLERLGVLRPDRLRILRPAVFAALLGWVPLVVLAWRKGMLYGVPGSLLGDFALTARSLIAVPIFLLAETVVLRRLSGIGAHFRESGLVDDDSAEGFAQAVASTRRLRDSVFAEVLVIVVGYMIIYGLARSFPTRETQAWQRSDIMGLPGYSPAGLWHMVVSLPLLLILFLGWIWRLFLWARFLRLVSRLHLNLIAAHPDHAAGLKFVGHSVRAWTPIGFGMGFVIAGSLANRVLQGSAGLSAFRAPALILLGVVALLFAGPLLCFMAPLNRTRIAGIFGYGRLADVVGREFESKWMKRRAPDQTAEFPEDPLSTQAFSATTDLYQVVGNVYDMFIVPVDLISLVMLGVITLVPLLPVILLVVPFQVIAEAIVSHLF
ncbi:MAG TPA: hypothetical protein VH438_16525 [Gemmatimonadales bacterium]|jgi:hypothetical protein